MFSDREQKIIEIIGRKRVTLAKIAGELFRSEQDRPFESSIVVGNSVGRIIKKCEHHKLPWTLTKRRENRLITIKREKTQ